MFEKLEGDEDAGCSQLFISYLDVVAKLHVRPSLLLHLKQLNAHIRRTSCTEVALEGHLQLRLPYTGFASGFRP